jgi:hypothetical protein
VSGQLYSQGKNPEYPWTWRLSMLRTRLEHHAEKKSVTVPGMELQIFQPSAQSLLNIEI